MKQAMARNISPPPTYSESGYSQDTKAGANGCGPWLVQRTSIHIESTSIDEGSILRPSISPSISSDNSSSRYRRFGKRTPHHDHSSIHQGLPQASDTQTFGSSVTIEAARPLRSQAERRIELKGLEQAASAKRWIGNSRPAEAWGKLMKDPELWDESGDTLIYFGYHRQDASFRIKSSLLEETKSEYLCSKLREGLRKGINDPRPLSPATMSSSALRETRSLNFGQQSRSDHSSGASNIDVRHQLYFPPSPQASRLDMLRYHITTRNLLALLKNKPLVGLTYYQALVDLQERLEDVLPQSNSTQTIMKYLLDNKLHNVSNDPSAAAGLLAWSEDNFWLEGWREGFVHCNGTYPQLRIMLEFRDVSHPSRLLLENSSLELQNRIRETEERLSSFHFDDVWQVNKDRRVSIPHSFHSFRAFLIRHYEKAFKTWPPRKTHGAECWLNRALVLQLQQDFGALYNFLVDHSATWNQTQERVVRQIGDRGAYSAAADGLCLENFLLAFDRRHHFNHIPKPFPLLPQVATLDTLSKLQQTRSLFGTRNRATEKRNIAASAAASNASLLGSEICGSPLVAAFLKFERSDRNREEDPFTIRKARWLLLYGILQFLDHLAFVTPHTSFSRDVDYFLNIKTGGLTPWKVAGDSVDESVSSGSHGWLASPLS